MPTIKIKRIYSCSSEDEQFPCSNLLGDAKKQWKCKSQPEELISVVFQLEEPTQITGIDIGNAHSAFVEVQVKKSISSPDDQYTEILLSSSFMTPLESRNSTNPNRVRGFTKNALVQNATNQKWELVKVICTQPFNKHVRYGLSFITFQTPKLEETTTAVNKVLVPEKFLNSNLGKFKLREESPESETEGLLFSRYMDKKKTPEKTATAAIRDASTPAATKIQANSSIKKMTPKPNGKEAPIETKCKDRNRTGLMYDKDEEILDTDEIEKQIADDKVRLQRERDDRPAKKHKMDSSIAKFKEFTTDDSSSSGKKNESPNRYGSSSSSKTSSQESNYSKHLPSSSSKITPSPNVIRNHRTDDKKHFSKRQSSPLSVAVTPASKKHRPDPKHTFKPFKKLLEGVVLVISGIQNPERANIRTMALQLGAKYKPDWESGCTHLICAFKNTPKYNQVHGQGKIIYKDWIADCHRKKKRLSWRRFALDSDDRRDPDSDAEIWDESLKDTVRPQHSSSSQESAKSSGDPKINETNKHSASPPKKIQNRIIYDSSDDDILEQYDAPDPQVSNSSGSDTEDEIARVTSKIESDKSTKKKDGDNSETVQSVDNTVLVATKIEPQKTTKLKDPDDPFDKTTEEEDVKPTGNSSRDSITPPPAFFTGHTFYLSDKLSLADEKKLKRLIAGFNGNLLLENPSGADFIISENPVDIASSFSGEILRPTWVYECDDMEALVSTSKYRV